MTTHSGVLRKVCRGRDRVAGPLLDVAVRGSAFTCLMALMVFALAACQGSPAGSGPRSPELPTVTSSKDLQAEAKGAAIKAYEGMWNAYAEAGETANHKSPKISRYATGNARTRIVAALLSYRDEGLVTKGRPKLSPEVTSMKPASRPSTVEISDCADSTGWTTHKRGSGDQVDEPAGKRKITATVVLKDGDWKVKDFDAKEIGSC